MYLACAHAARPLRTAALWQRHHNAEWRIYGQYTYGGEIMANPFVHVELTTTDVAKAKSFYTALFDWKLEDMEMAPGHSYTMIRVGEGTGGGMMKIPAPAAPAASSPAIPTAWMPYVHVDDVRAATSKARALGATVVKDVTEVTEAGYFSVIIDPTGAAIGLWQPKAK
jgi:uncharacterized protein